MTELPKLSELSQDRIARQGVDAIERAMREPPASPPVEIALYVNGRLVTTKTDSETVFRVLAILTGLDR